MWDIRPEQPSDGTAVEALVERCFGPGRFAKSAYRLREGVASVPELSFVAIAKEGGALLGSVHFWPIAVGGLPALLLGPLAVQPDLRGKGIGIMLMQRGLDAARARGHGVVIVVGDEPYYAKVGFARLPPGRLQFPGPVDPARVLGLSLKPGALVSLHGQVARARIDILVSAQATKLG